VWLPDLSDALLAKLFIGKMPFYPQNLRMQSELKGPASARNKTRPQMAQRRHQAVKQSLNGKDYSAG
jgi:hypothetical protein